MAELIQFPHPEVEHHPSQRGARRPLGGELRTAEFVGVRRRGHGVEAKLLAVGIDDADKLDVERVELKLVVAAIAGDKRHRGGRTRLDAADVRREGADLGAEILQQFLVAGGAVADGLPQGREGVRVEHGHVSRSA
jgi:hypothetical protein